MNLEAAQARLKIKLGERTTELKQDKEIRETMLRDARSENKTLEKSLYAINI